MANVLSLVSYKIFPARLGGQKGIALFNEYFSKYHTLTCITIKDNDPKFASYNVLNILSNSKYRYINFFYFFTLKKIIKKNTISHLIIEHPYFGWLGILLKEFCKIKLVVHSHNIESERFKAIGKWWWRLLSFYERFIYKNADIVFCINEEDREYMITKFFIDPSKCTVITYGIEWNITPDKKERFDAKNNLLHKYGLPGDTILYLFNGTLDYPPNLNAVKDLLNNINPILLRLKTNYKIIICGKNLPVEMNELSEYSDANIIYAGFVDDISVYFKGTDVFVNPIKDGGGIKTKLVEALGYNLNAVSTINGAIGIDENLCNGKLLLTADQDWQGFAEEMQKAINITFDIPHQYFKNFYWVNIAAKAAKVITDL